MTYLELVAAVGSVPMDIACMYFNGRLTEREMKNVIGWKKAGLVECFYLQNRNDENNQIRKCCLLYTSPSPRDS